MSTECLIRDENLTGQSTQHWKLEVPSERCSIREIIRSRVYQEVQDFNLKEAGVFQGLVQPENAEQVLSGWKLKKPRLLDWKQQFERAIEAFDKRQVLILVDDRQAIGLDDAVDIKPGTEITFLRLTLLVGG